MLFVTYSSYSLFPKKLRIRKLLLPSESEKSFKWFTWFTRNNNGHALTRFHVNYYCFFSAATSLIKFVASSKCHLIKEEEEHFNCSKRSQRCSGFTRLFVFVMKRIFYNCSQYSCEHFKSYLNTSCADFCVSQIAIR